jgi:hypothetical protein
MKRYVKQLVSICISTPYALRSFAELYFRTNHQHKVHDSINLYMRGIQKSNTLTAGGLHCIRWTGGRNIAHVATPTLTLPISDRM